MNAMTPQTGVCEPLVVITFDDGHPSVYSIAYKRMQKMKPALAATHFLPTSYIETDRYKNRGTTLAQIKEMEADGWETGGHGFTHENLSSVLLDSARSQVRLSYTFLRGNNLSSESFAYPTGNYNFVIQREVGRWFHNIRTSHDFLYTDGVNRKELGYFAVREYHSGNDIIARIELARSLGAELVIIGFHAIVPDTESPPTNTYWCKESAFVNFLKYLKKQELPVVTLKDAMHILCD